MGFSDEATVRHLFLTADLMICPVRNDFGVKFKTLEALAYGTPLLASKQTLLGIPHLSGSPTIDLEDASGAAKTVSNLIGDPAKLIALQSDQQAAQRDFIAASQGIWSKTLASLAS